MSQKHHHSKRYALLLMTFMSLLLLVSSSKYHSIPKSFVPRNHHDLSSAIHTIGNDDTFGVRGGAPTKKPVTKAVQAAPAPGLMDNVAKLGSIALAVFGVLAYLGWGLSLGFAEDIIEQLASFFGVLSPLAMPPHDVNVVGLSFFCFCVGAVNLLSLKSGKDEKPGAIIAREDINMVTYGALSTTYILALKSGTLSGSGPTFWTVFATVQFLAHYKIVSGNMGGIRKSMKDNLFKGTIGNVDLVNSVMFVMYGVMMFLSMGLNLEGLHGLMSSLMSLFGMLEPSPPAIAKSIATVFGGACALGVAALNLPGFAGAAEDKDYAQVRRFASVAFWAASVIGMSSFPESGSFYSVWSAVSLIMALLLK